MSVKKEAAKKVAEAFSRHRKARDKVNSCRVDFNRKEEEVRGDLEEAGKFWRELSQKFKWWQTLP